MKIRASKLVAKTIGMEKVDRVPENLEQAYFKDLLGEEPFSVWMMKDRTGFYIEFRGKCFKTYFIDLLSSEY